jgi:hypothetical protein
MLRCPGFRDRQEEPNLVTLARSLLVRVTWFVCAVLLAFGAGGIVSGMAHQPATPARAELTWAGDQRIGPELVGAATDLDKLTEDVDGLGNLGTRALVAVNGGDTDRIRAAISDGEKLLGTIETETQALRTRLAAIQGVGAGAELRLGGLPLRRYETLTGALDATDGLRNSWGRLTAGSLAALQLQTSLADHDTSTAAAARLGTAGKYADALTQLDRSDASIAAARAQREQMSASMDVTILTDWVDRNADYDVALRRLYTALRSSNGKATPAVSKAYAAELAARERLPHDTRGLIIIMAEVARNGLNEAVIDIEHAKGRLRSALDAFNEATGPDGSPGSPSP